MAKSPYIKNKVSVWGKITDELIKKHPLTEDEIVGVILKSWEDIFKSKIGSFFIGKEIFPTPQIMSFLLHELVAHYLGLNRPDFYKVGTGKTEKDVHCIKEPELSIEIKASSHSSQIFANRSYAQPGSAQGKKNKNGYYITINFEKFDRKQNKKPDILLIRFGYLEHKDWKAQKSATGQQARLSPNAYKYKLKIIYSKTK